MTRDLVVDAAMGVAGTAAAVASFSALQSLATACGWSEPFAALLPLSVDAVAVAAGRTWLAGTGPARSYARVLTLLALGFSVCGNAMSHWITASGTAPGWPLIVAVSGVPPLALAAVVHLAALSRTPASVPTRGPVPATAEPVPVEAEPEPVSVSDVPNKRRQARWYWDAARAAGQDLTGAELDRLLGTRGYGRKLVREFQAATA